MYETLLHPHQVEPITPPLPISVASANLKRLEIRKEEKRLRQIASAQRSAASAKRKRIAEDEEDGEDGDEDARLPAARLAALSDAEFATHKDGLVVKKLERAKNQLKSSMMMALESRDVEVEDLGRQVSPFPTFPLPFVADVNY